MKILITGGLGFIGGNFIRYLLGRYRKINIVNFDKQTYAGCPSSLKDYCSDPRYEFVKGDICNARKVAAALKGCDALVNFAAETHVDRSIVSAAEFLRTNVMGVQVLLEAARENRIKRFVHISTDEVYGSRDKGSFTEESPLEPNSPYSASKAAADLLIRSYWKTHNFAPVIIRPTNNFGPFQFPEKVIPFFVTNLLQGEQVPVYGDGLNVRDWLFVLDNCRAIDLVLRKAPAGAIYNVGAGNEITNIDLTRQILKIMKMPASRIKFVKDRPGHDWRYSLDTTRLRALGFEPAYSFEDALQLTLDWYLGNQKWWKRLIKRS